MLDDVKIKDQQERLFKSCQYARLSIGHSNVERDLRNNVPEFYNQNDGFLRKASVTIGNAAKENNTAKLQTIKGQIDQQFLDFSRKNSIQNLLQNFQQLKNYANEIFYNDVYGLGRVMFSVSIIFDGEYQYHYDSDGLKHISMVLWNDETSLACIKNKIQEIYCDLARQPLSSNQKMLLAGTAALALATTVVPIVMLGGLSASGITGGLAGFGAALGLGGTMVEGIGLMAITELLVDSAIIGFAYTAMDFHNRNMVKKSFRRLNYNEIARMLAIKCFLMKHAKQTMPEYLYKEKLNELLQMIQDLKSDTDYVLLVENQDVENNQKKIQVFHNLDKKLYELLFEKDINAKYHAECRKKYREWLQTQGKTEN